MHVLGHNQECSFPTLGCRCLYLGIGNVCHNLSIASDRSDDGTRGSYDLLMHGLLCYTDGVQATATEGSAKRSCHAVYSELLFSAASSTKHFGLWDIALQTLRLVPNKKSLFSKHIICESIQFISIPLPLNLMLSCTTFFLACHRYRLHIPMYRVIKHQHLT